MKDAHCSTEQLMVVQKADYGDFNNNGVFDSAANIDETCSQMSNCKVKSLCSGNRSCDLTIDNNLLPSQYCSDTLKEIYTKYTCEDGPPSRIIEKGITLTSDIKRAKDFIPERCSGYTFEY